MLTLRYLIRLIKAFLTRFKGILLIGVALGIVFFVVLQILGPTVFTRSTERIGITGRYRTDNLPDFIIEKVGDGLTKLDENGIAEPSLASSWETPDKGKTWFFHLDEERFWQDDKKVTSDTIGYDFSDVEIELPDDKTIVFKLQNAFSPFPTVVSKPTFKKGLLGTGDCPTVLNHIYFGLHLIVMFVRERLQFSQMLARLLKVVSPHETDNEVRSGRYRRWIDLYV